MDDIANAIGLVLLIEGALYFLAPQAMRRMMQQALMLSEDTLRTAGLGVAVLGMSLVWAVQRL